MRARIALLAVLALAALGAPAGAAAAEGEPSFCERTTLHDYLKPLQRLPELRERPFRRIAEPFFRGVRIGASGPTLAVNGGSAGYQFQWDKNPGWDITLTLAQLRADGTVRRPLGERRSRFDDLGQALVTEPHFSLPHKPGFYRTTLLIRSRSGRKLAEFGNYYRVVRPKIDDRLVAERPSYLPGETLFARLENRGAAFVLYGDGFDVEGMQGGAWGPAGTGYTPLHFVAPGTTGNQCLAFAIPATLPAGRYRLAQETVLGWPAGTVERRPFLYAEFDIGAPLL